MSKVQYILILMRGDERLYGLYDLDDPYGIDGDGYCGSGGGMGGGSGGGIQMEGEPIKRPDFSGITGDF